MLKNKRKYCSISVEEISTLLDKARFEYLEFCRMNAVCSRGDETSQTDKDFNILRRECLSHLKKSTGIFDEVMRRVARDYSDEKYAMLDNYYRSVRIEEAWGTRLWMNIFYNLMGFPKTFWLMRHFKWLL